MNVYFHIGIFVHVFTTTTKITFLVEIEKAEVQYLLNAFPTHVKICNKITTYWTISILLYTNLKIEKKNIHILLLSNSVE